MFNKFKVGTKVIVYGPGESEGKFYKNIPAIVIDYDSYYEDYYVRFNNGIEDWISKEYIRKPYTRRSKSL